MAWIEPKNLLGVTFICFSNVTNFHFNSPPTIGKSSMAKWEIVILFPKHVFGGLNKTKFMSQHNRQGYVPPILVPLIIALLKWKQSLKPLQCYFDFLFSWLPIFLLLKWNARILTFGNLFLYASTSSFMFILLGVSCISRLWYTVDNISFITKFP